MPSRRSNESEIPPCGNGRADHDISTRSAGVTSDSALSDFLVWQLADSTFPTGGFAHSGGLEAALQYGELRGAKSLLEFLQTALSQLVHASMPFCHAAFVGSAEFAEIDETCDAFLSNHIANRASRLQGRALAASSERAFNRPALGALRRELLEKNLPGHYAPVFGAVLRLLGIRAETAGRLFVFTHLRGWISAAVRLNVVGPLEGQNLQQRLATAACAAAAEFGCRVMSEAAQTAPLLDLWQGGQDRLYSRLFQS